MKIFFDTEFTGLHKDTTLISIGLISEDRRCFYAELTDYKRTLSDADNWNWIEENVIANLYKSKSENDRKYIPNYHIGTKDDIALALGNWFKQFGQVELVSDVCHYDMVLLIDLFGTAFNLPDNVSASCYDINQDIARYYKISQLEAFDKSREEILWDRWRDGSVSGDKHNSLYDAKVIRELYQILNNVDFDKH